jgi:hypothetical protein
MQGSLSVYIVYRVWRAGSIKHHHHIPTTLSMFMLSCIQVLQTVSLKSLNLLIYEKMLQNSMGLVIAGCYRMRCIVKLRRIVPACDRCQSHALRMPRSCRSILPSHAFTIIASLQRFRNSLRIPSHILCHLLRPLLESAEILDTTLPGSRCRWFFRELYDGFS